MICRISFQLLGPANKNQRGIDTKFARGKPVIAGCPPNLVHSIYLISAGAINKKNGSGSFPSTACDTSMHVLFLHVSSISFHMFPYPFLSVYISTNFHMFHLSYTQSSPSVSLVVDQSAPQVISFLCLPISAIFPL